MAISTQNQTHLLADKSPGSLRTLFQRVYQEFRFYRTLFDKNGIDPNEDPVTVLDRLPILLPEDYLLLEADVFDRMKGKHFLTDYTSGTTGSRRIKFTTAADEAQEEMLCMRFFRKCGLEPKDRVVALDIDSADIHLFYGRAMQRIGVEKFMYLSVPYDFEGCLEDVIAFQPSVFLSIPSVIARCYRKLEELLAEGCQMPGKLIYFGEPMSSSLRKKLTRDFGMEVFSFYGSTETGSMAGECRRHEGVHLYNDAVIPTLLDPSETCDIVSGEVVWTTPFFRDQPLIKYATRDFVRVRKTRCSCSLPYPLMVDIRRTAEQFIMYGHKFMYEAFEKALEGEVGQIDFLQIRLRRATGEDEVTFVLPEHLARQKDAVLETIMRTDDIDYFQRQGFLRCVLQFREISSFRERKMAKIVDERGDLSRAD